jgi:hypothetical protein
MGAGTARCCHVYYHMESVRSRHPRLIHVRAKGVVRHSLSKDNALLIVIWLLLMCCETNEGFE